MKVAIIGYGVEGKSAQEYWQTQTADICIRDAKTDLDLPDSINSKLGADYLTDLGEYDLIVRSPGTRPNAIFEANPGLDSAKITSVTREFMAKCPAPIIGVTGTKGKGTTCTLITKILEAGGRKVWLGGNIGTPALDFLDQVRSTDVVVLELSSFQLMDATQSPHRAVMLMVASDHLNYHPDLDEYQQAKANIFRFQQSTDVAVYNANDMLVNQLVKLSSGNHIPYGIQEGAYVSDGSIWFEQNRICSTDQVGLIGLHNLDNVCAAVAATWDIMEDAAPIARAIKEFKGLPHRLELVGEVDGVGYFDDSMSTIPENSIVAIQAFKQPKVIILGGSDKGAAFDELAEAIKGSNVELAIIMGETAAKITLALDRVGFTRYITDLTDMDQIVRAAAKAVPKGGVVLLSPASASFGLFRDYRDRGDQFTAAVKKLNRE